MRPLIEFLHESLHQKEDEFLKRHPYPVLIHRLKRQVEIGFSPVTQFVPSLQKAAPPPNSVAIANTKAMVHLARALSSLSPTTQHIEDGSILVFPIIRPASVPPLGPLTIGRSGAIVDLPFPKISKVHAYLTLAGDHVFLADAGSRNGTQVGGKPLAPRERVEIEDGTLVQFSQYSFVFFSARGFFRLLSAG